MAALMEIFESWNRQRISIKYWELNQDFIQEVRKINMMKEVTILTFDETEHLRNRLNSIIDGLKVGTEEKDSATYSCEWAIGQVKEIREMFD